jgi:hypothetical protein
LNSEISLKFCRKYLESVELLTRFPMIYNMLQISALKHDELLRNVVIRFSRLRFFLVYWPLRYIFPNHLLMDFSDFFFIRKIKLFFTNCWNKFLNYASVVQIYENLGNSSKQFSRFSVWNDHYISTKANFKNLFQQFVDTSFSFILKQFSQLSELPCTRKMYRAESPVFGAKFSITP